jgi:hypothetical protein
MAIRFLLIRLAITSLTPDRITTTNCAAPRYSSIDTDVGLITLGRRAEDSWILGEIPLRESGHHATPARTSDVQAHRRSDGKRVTDPGILREALLS